MLATRHCFADDRAKFLLKLSKKISKSLNFMTAFRISIRKCIQIGTNMPGNAFVIHKIVFQIHRILRKQSCLRGKATGHRKH